MTVTIALNSSTDPKCTNEIVLRDANKIQRILDKDESKILIEDNWALLGSFFVKDVQEMSIKFDK